MNKKIEKKSDDFEMGNLYETINIPQHDMAVANADDIAEGRVVTAGQEWDETEAHYLASRAEIEEALRQVYDPEIPVNIYDLGLIYELEQKPNGNIDIVMTLTAPACPVAGELPRQVAEQVALVEGVAQVTVTLTWQPAWSMARMSEDAKLAMGFM